MKPPAHLSNRLSRRRRSTCCVEPLERRALFSAEPSPVTYHNVLGAQFGTPNALISIVASETALEAALAVGSDEAGFAYRALGYSVPTAFDVAANVKSAHLEANVVIQDWDGGTYGDGMYLLVIDVDFTAYEPADLYAGSLPDGRSLYISQGAELSGSIVIEPLPGGPPLPADIPTVLLSPQDGKVGAGSTVIMQTRNIQPPHWPDSSFGVKGSTVARDLFSQTPVLN